MTAGVFNRRLLTADFDKKLEQFKKDQQAKLDADKGKITDNFGKELKEFQAKSAADLAQEKKKLSDAAVCYFVIMLFDIRHLRGFSHASLFFQNVAKLQEDLAKSFATESTRLNEEHSAKVSQLKADLQKKFDADSRDLTAKNDEKIKDLTAQNDRTLAELKSKLETDKVFMSSASLNTVSRDWL